MKCFNKLWNLFVMLCYIYCSLATAYAETMRSVKQEECSTSQLSQGCCTVFSRPSFLQGSLARLVSTRTVHSLHSWNWETASCFSYLLLCRVDPHMGCQFEDKQQRNKRHFRRWTLFHQHFNIPLVIVIRWMDAVTF